VKQLDWNCYETDVGSTRQSDVSSAAGLSAQPVEHVRGNSTPAIYLLGWRERLVACGMHIYSAAESLMLSEVVSLTGVVVSLTSASLTMTLVRLA
jgi:hypothetical protein